MDKKLVDILVCPLCNGALKHKHHHTLEELICRPCGLAFPIHEGIPFMLETEARTLTTDERLKE